MMNQRFLIISLEKAWSDEARAAAAEARKAANGGETSTSKPEQGPPKETGANASDVKEIKGGWHNVAISENTKFSTRVNATVEITGRTTPPPAAAHVPTDYRPVDYGEAGQFIKEKYGEARGEKAYHDMIDLSGASRGLHFVAGTKIVAEKMTMMRDLGKSGDPRDHHYQGLYRQWKHGDK